MEVILSCDSTNRYRPSSLDTKKNGVTTHKYGQNTPKTGFGPYANPEIGTVRCKWPRNSTGSTPMGIKFIPYSSILNVDMVCRFRNMIPSRSWPLNRGYLTGGISSNTPDLEVKIDSKIISETGKPTFRFKGFWLVTCSSPSDIIQMGMCYFRIWVFPDLHMAPVIEKAE